ncbi:cytochrome P450 [Actinokineospora sp. NBRC 105648]|uniref:cytochrome P450 n=1 Tax=Actinokineospora sp. NBRC 105648 TaxID=3032206 RepID=UPI0025555321|nr:cytochrome P450 [Actinokineospora sp. NBRC 105648]
MTVVDRVDRWVSGRPWPVTEFASPPPGLLPVPGDGGLPVIGHTVGILRRGVDFGLERYRRFGAVSWIRAFGVRMVTAVGPDAAQEVFANKDKAFSQQGWEYFLGPFFPRGLMLLDFEEHLFHRRLMQEAFTAPRIEGYLERVAEVARRQVPAWSGTLAVYPRLKELTLDIAAEVFMGGPRDPRLTGAFVDVVRGGTALVRHPVPGGRWAAGLRGRRTLEAYFRTQLDNRRDGTDLFSALRHARLDDGATFSDDDVVNHMIFLMMAAHDTSTVAATAAVYHLAKHPEWQERARAESAGLGDGPLGTVELDRLTTLDHVIKESLRLVTPVPSLTREAVKDTEVLGHFVPAGTMVTLTPWLNHLLPEYWPDPHRFDPDRFAEGRREDKVHRYAWMPFGGGVHKCIGLHFGMYEIKTLLHEMLRQHSWSLPPGYEVSWDQTALPIPKDGLPVRFG